MGSAWKRSTIPIRPNEPGFPSVVLRPGQEYRTTTVYKFSAE